jgi:hypothetical protein
MNLSLRRFHEIFLLAAIVMADLFGAWTIRYYLDTGDVLTLILGIFTLVGGLVLCGYVLFFEREVTPRGVR